MTWIAPKLKHRVQIQKAVQTADDSNGSLDTTYTTIKTIWSAMENDKRAAYISAIRGVQIQDEKSSNIFKMRSAALRNLNIAFTRGFNISFDSIEDINILKSNYFIFVNKGSSVKGRRYRIKGIRLDDDRQEYIKVYAEEIEENGTGW